ncbi:uncharacterized protein LOC112964921 [Apteryx rowi]|uniref:uncharacterized protein LOC112964921 n=1 Tax=Apteryx rowi TaxID=308060 RepID=UPI000E1E29CA|nr:uncharacterized protein LOC112964921 [Apteryx rowi]
MHANASMLSYVFFSCLLLSVQAHDCQVREIMLFTNRLLAEKLQDKTSVNCSCREPTANSCLCLPIPEPGHELSCFVEGTERLMNASVTSEATTLQLLNRSFQTQLERKFCGQLSRSDQCQSKTKGNMKEFLTQIRKSYQEINKSKA